MQVLYPGKDQGDRATHFLKDAERFWKLSKTGSELRLGEILCTLRVDSPDICALFVLILRFPEISFWHFFADALGSVFCHPFAGKSLFCFVEGGSRSGFPRSAIKQGVAAVM